MKGFLYLVEIIVAAVLIAIIFQSFFAAQSDSSDWARSDLIGIGNNVMDILGSNVIKTLNETQTLEEIDDMKAANIRYTMKFSGIPKNTINVGTNDINNIEPILITDTHVNNREIEFNVSTLAYDFNTYDVIIINNTFDYSNQTLINFVKEKTVIGIGTEGTNYESFFNIETTISPPEEMNFTQYDDISKYFLGFGFTIQTPRVGDSEANSWYGEWNVRGQTLIVNATIEGNIKKVCISTSSSCRPSYPEKSIIPVPGTVINVIVKKIELSGSRNVQFGVPDSNFIFSPVISEMIKPITIGNSIIGNDDNAAVTKFGNAIWVSKILTDSEYATLLKSLTANSVKEWYLKKPGDQYVEIPRLNSLCCDIPEIVETSLVLWYVY